MARTKASETAIRATKNGRQSGLSLSKLGLKTGVSKTGAWYRLQEPEPSSNPPVTLKEIEEAILALREQFPHRKRIGKVVIARHLGVPESTVALRLASKNKMKGRMHGPRKNWSEDPSEELSQSQMRSVNAMVNNNYNFVF